MEPQELQEFIYFITRNKQLSRRQLRLRDSLLARDCAQNGDVPPISNSPTNRASKAAFISLSVIETAKFLSLFNDPLGLKYLTHDFDHVYDGRPQTLDDLYKQVKQLLENKDLKIPSSLWAPINNYLQGGKEWRDTFGMAHNSFIIDGPWKEWSLQNSMHPINNPAFAVEIMAFRATIRLVSPFLKEICNKAKTGLSLLIKEENLEKADFYTNTYVLYLVIRRILSMMNRRVDKSPDVRIAYKRSSDSEGRMIRQIQITQYGSYADKPLDEIRRRLSADPEAGDFGSIRNSLNGYCLWRVESLWAGKPLRWNILKTDEMSEIENLDKNNIEGFTHTFTFYIL